MRGVCQASDENFRKSFEYLKEVGRKVGGWEFWRESSCKAEIPRAGSTSTLLGWLSLKHRFAGMPALAVSHLCPGLALSSRQESPAPRADFLEPRMRLSRHRDNRSLEQILKMCVLKTYSGSDT